MRLVLVALLAGCHAPPGIDGVIGKDEWRGATELVMEDARAYVRRDASGVAIGVDDRDRGIGTVVVAADQIYVLHASAAPG